MFEPEEPDMQRGSKTAADVPTQIDEDATASSQGRGFSSHGAIPPVQPTGDLAPTQTASDMAFGGAPRQLAAGAGAGSQQGAAGGKQDAAGGKQADREADLANRAGATDPDHAGPQPFPAPPGSTLRQRHDAANTRLQVIDASVGHEDVSHDKDPTRRTGQTKDDHAEGRMTVAAQLAATGLLQAAMQARAPSESAVKAKDAAPVAAFETAVRAYQDAYERTYLVSTDGPVDRATPWTSSDDRTRLSERDHALGRLRAWGTEGSPSYQPYIKFVVPAGHPNDVYLGVASLGHVDIAQDNALTAGILKVRITGSTIRVSQLENASGGYRPGPLRNALVLSRLIDAGLVEDDLSGTEVGSRADGSYVGSRINPP